MELEAEIKELIARNREKPYQGEKKKPAFENVTKSKALVQPQFPNLSKDQLRRLRQWLTENRLCKSATQARKATENPKRCKETFLKHIQLTEDEQNIKIHDIMEMYYVHD